MIYTIANKFITVQASDMGGELQSIRSAEGIEYLWQGDKTYWGGRAYNLFPIVGRLTEGKYTWQGKTYEMNLHGFVRKTALTLVEQKSDKLVFHLAANDATRAMYPFDFDYTLTYTLKGASVSTTVTVRNPGAEKLPFAVGGHPGFNVPINGEGAFEDYYLEFDCERQPRAIQTSPTCYILHETREYPLEEGRRIRLRHDLFDNDAIMLENVCTAVTIRSDKTAHALRVEYPDMKYLGLWHKPLSDAPYVCIEPWTSLPAYDGEVDDLATKRDMMKLAPGGSYTNTFPISVK